MATTTQTPEIMTPTRAQLHGLLDAIQIVCDIIDDDRHEGCSDGTTYRVEPLSEEAERILIDTLGYLEEMVDDAREALAEADEPRLWSLREQGYEFRVFLGTRAEAIAEAENCGGDEAVCEETGEEVEVEPDAPECVTRGQAASC